MSLRALEDTLESNDFLSENLPLRLLLHACERVSLLRLNQLDGSLLSILAILNFSWSNTDFLSECF